MQFPLIMQFPWIMHAAAIMQLPRVFGGADTRAVPSGATIDA
jgi:hypothetical protein